MASSRSSMILDWVLLERVHKVMKDEITKGEIGFDTARNPATGKPVANVMELLEIFLEQATPDGLINMDDNVKLCSKIYPDVAEDTLRTVVAAYQKETAPELVE